ncbi:MAG: hypothetical protein NTY48_04515 [Candidatus Diapherotrites archaeon]|nr:hypothetical protein [Candidatus Diapherotrites archaeon]
MRKFVSVLFLVLLVVLLALPVFSDGMMTMRLPEGWSLNPEKEQIAMINYEDGYENMLLSVGFDPSGSEAVWIFPVPAAPEKTVINVSDSIPSFYTTDFKQKISRAFSDNFLIMRLTQIYPVPAFIMLGSATVMYALEEDQINSKDTGFPGGVNVYESIIKNGVTTQLVTASNGSALYDYVALKGATLPEESKSVLNEYVGKDYSFVVTWISDLNEYASTVAANSEGNYYRASRKMLSVFVKFPTTKIFFPLRLTSVYGSASIPVKMYVASFVTPEFYPEIAQQAKVSYLVANYYRPKTDIEREFFNQKESIPSLNLTKIEFTVPSKYLSADLWLNTSVPAGVSSLEFISKNNAVVGVVLFIIISCLASVVAGFFVFRKDSPDLKKFALFGLVNFVTLIGFFILSYVLKVNTRFSKAKEPQNNQFTIKQYIFTVLFWNLIAAVIFTVIFTLLVLVPSLLSGYPIQNPLYIVSTVLSVLLAVFTFFLIFSLPIGWVHFNRNKTSWFILAFAVLFMVLSFIFEYGLKFFLGL